jgi:hypothetical protein
MKDTSIRHAPKPTACDYQNEQEGSQKKSEALLQSEAQNDGQEKENNQCLDTWISFQAVEDLPSQPVPLEEYEQLSLWKSTPTLNSSCDRTSQEFQFTPISEITTQNQENSIFYRWDSPVWGQVMQELEQDYLTQNQHFGEKDLDALLKLNPSSVLSNSLKELSDEDFELFLGDLVWQDTLGRLAMSRQQSLGRVIKDLDYLSFPTLTSGARGTTSRPAGQTKCEKWFKDNGLIPNGSQLGTKAIALTMGFPFNWFVGLSEQYSKSATTQSQVKHQAELEPDILQDEQLHQDKQRSLSKESSISIPCLVKQPKQPEVKGIIRKDLGDRFLVEVSDEIISISKLFVYPDFSASVGQISPTRKQTPPSKIPPSKTRRKKGDGTGYIYRRTITRRGKEYPESYFRYRDESGKLRSKYIPQKLIDKVQEAESQKKPIADILVLLGGDEISRGEQFSICEAVSFRTLDAQKLPNGDQNNEVMSTSRGEQLTPPSTRKRKQGDGTGYIECKPIKRSGKEYQQYWYHYEEWRSGDRLSKKSKYIPSRMRSQIEKMNNEKAPVEEILKVLSNKSKRK